MNSKYPIYGVTLLLAITLFACNKMPKGILTEGEMQEVMTDMLVAEALISNNYQQYKEDSVKLALYESVFRKHHTSQAVYDSSLIWYGKNIDIYMRVIDKTIVELARRKNEMGDIPLAAAPVSTNDSVNIWPRRTFMVLQPKSVFNGVVFDIKPDANYPSGSMFQLAMDVWGLKEGMTHYPEIRLSAVHRDTIVTMQSTLTDDGSFETLLRTIPTKQVSRVYGYIRLDNSDSTYNRVFLDNIRLIRYNYNSRMYRSPEE